MCKVARNEAEAMAFETVANVVPGLLVNLAMGSAAQYKRIVRGVQRKWRTRFQCRTLMLMDFAEQQLLLIIETHPQLNVAEKWYRDTNRVWYVCLEYQKEVASRMVDYVEAYHKKLKELEEYKKINR
jgi:hypothetical protein